MNDNIDKMDYNELLGKPVAARLNKKAEIIINEGRNIGHKILNRRKWNNESYFKNPKVLVIQVGDRFDSNSYIRNKTKLMDKLNIVYHLEKFPEDISCNDLKDFITSNQFDYHGVFIQLPLPEKLKRYEQSIIDCIDPQKDIDCLTTQNIGKLALTKNTKYMLKPATALGIIEMLDYYGIKIEGARVSIIGRSNLVGKPLIQLLLNRNATVTSINSYTKELTKSLHYANIVIVAVGEEKFLQYAPSNSVVIDVGINRNEKGKLVGDVDYNYIVKKFDIKGISPVPSGVGVTTVSSLMINIAIAYFNHMQLFDK